MTKGGITNDLKERRKSILYAFVALLFSIVLYFKCLNGQSVQDTLSGNGSLYAKRFWMCQYNFFN